MTDLDLSRLTDEERTVYDACKRGISDAYFDDFGAEWIGIEGVFRALIAARAENKRLRAENKRKDEAIEAAARLLDTLYKESYQDGYDKFGGNVTVVDLESIRLEMNAVESLLDEIQDSY